MMQTTNFLRGFPRKEEVKVKQELCQTEGQRAKSMQRVWDSGNLSPSCFVLSFLKASTKVVPDRSLFPRGVLFLRAPVVTLLSSSRPGPGLHRLMPFLSLVWYNCSLAQLFTVHFSNTSWRMESIATVVGCKGEDLKVKKDSKKTSALCAQRARLNDTPAVWAYATKTVPARGQRVCLHWDINQGPGGLTGKDFKKGSLQGVGKMKEMSKANETLEVGNHGEILKQRCK